MTNLLTGLLLLIVNIILCIVNSLNWWFIIGMLCGAYLIGAGVTKKGMK